MSNARLVITDGTLANTASLNVDIGGSALLDWLPKSPQPANPIWASSPYQDGKHLVSKTYDNIIDTFTVVISSGQEDTTIHELRKFIILLERAVRYWTDEYNIYKYWLEVRAPCETNIRYAYIVDYNIPEIDNPFQPPFSEASESSTDEVQINIEHTIWTDSLTIGDNIIKTTAGRYGTTGAHTDVPHGVVIPTDIRAPAVVPFWNVNLLQHAYWNRGGEMGTWSANLVDYGLGVGNNELLPHNPAVGDRFMCCIEDNPPGVYGTPFPNIVIDLAVKSIGITTMDVMVSDGAGGWIVRTPNFNPINPLLPTATLGLNFVSYDLINTWLTDTHHAIKGFWLCFEVTGTSAGMTAPQKTDATPIYSVMWPWVQIDGGEIEGDIPAIIDFLLSNTKHATFTNILITAMKRNRTGGDRFVPYIAMSTHAATPAAYVVPGAHLTCTEVLNARSYAGYVANWAPAGIVAEDLVDVLIDRKIYAGRFRAFIRADVNAGGVGEIGLFLRIANNPSDYYDTPIVYNTSFLIHPQVFDMGLITISPDILLENNANEVQIIISGVTLAAAINVDLIDLALMPVDEMNLEISRDPAYSPTAITLKYTQKIITSNPKQSPYAFILADYGATDPFIIDWTYDVYSRLKVAVLGSFLLDPEEDYYLMFFMYEAIAATTDYFARIVLPILDGNQRYLLARGNE